MSSSNLNVTILPNPFTPLAFMSPESAYQTTVTNYASVGALAVLIWDILDNIVGDYYLIKSRFNISLIAYFLSRIGLMGYVLGSAIFTSAPTGNCAVFEKAVTSWFPLAVISTGFLFFLRLRAVYNRNRTVVAFFFIMWLGLLVSSIFVPLGVLGGPLAHTSYCKTAVVARSASVVHLAPLMYDTLVFVAISWRLCHIATIDPVGPRQNMQVLLLGRYLPAFTKSMLLDGQIYYLTTLIAGVSVAVLTFAPGVPGPLRYLAMEPYFTLVNIMACRVYRRTRTGVIRESEISTAAMTQPPPKMHPIMFGGEATGSLDGDLQRASSSGSDPSLKIERNSIV